LFLNLNFLDRLLDALARPPGFVLTLSVSLLALSTPSTVVKFGCALLLFVLVACLLLTHGMLIAVRGSG
jgi:hypothetical protein